jgi:hypothetical protein
VIKKSKVELRKQSATNLIKHLLTVKDGSYDSSQMRELLSTLIWKFTEASGKHKLDFMSRKAMSELNKKNLIHEHVFERAKLVSRLLEPCANIDEILRDALACLVTKEEHDQLDKLDSSLEGWDRYVAAHIQVFSTVTGERVILKRNKAA